MAESALPAFSPLEARVLGVLIEKQLTTPDYYPLTLNALVSGCNQKTGRNPVMNAGDADVQATVDALKRQTLIIDTYGASGRVMRYAHNVPKVLNVGQAVTALLAMLMLRGQQTAAELRGNTERLYQFADLSSVEAYLEEMATRSAGALVVKLPKQPGSREHRWAHLLSGPVHGDVAAETAEPRDGGISAGESAALKANMTQMRNELAELRALVERLFQELGVKR
jgi:uncharacterized protein YceH (UPF0502 family)